MSENGCRIDVWLWRARFFKTRTIASRFVEGGRVRLTRSAAQIRVDKPAHPVKPGDDLVFALGGRVVAVRIGAFGERRGPPAEARALYYSLDNGSSEPENSCRPNAEQR